MSRSHADLLLLWVLRIAAAVAGTVVVLVFGFLVVESRSAFGNVGFARFFTDASWHPGSEAADGLFNLTPMLVGTLLTMCGAVLLATPIGILSALFTQYYAPPVVARAYRRLVELLAGIPSVVYGFWGLVTIVPLIGRLQPPGPSLLAGIFLLALMILPTIALMADASLANVPREIMHGAAALGLSRWGIARRVALPAARGGLLTGVILQTGRAIGETMAILMVCGNVVKIPGSVFDPIRTLTANMALEMAYAMGDHRAALFVSGLLLMAMVVALVAAAEWISGGRLYA